MLGKKVKLSLLAASLIGLSAFAGNISEKGNEPGLISKEKVSIEDAVGVDVGNLIYKDATHALIYEPTDIPAGSLKNPIFRFDFNNAKNLNVDPNAKVWMCELDANGALANCEKVADNPQISGADSNVVTFTAVDAGTYVYNNRKYIIAPGDDNGNPTAFAANKFKLDVSKGSTGTVNVTAKLFSGDSQENVDSASTGASIAKIDNEYVGAIGEKFDATIDASAGFKVFFSNHDNGNNKSDTLKFTLERKNTLPNATLNVDTVLSIVEFDQNLTKVNYATTWTNATQQAKNDNNVTATTTVNAGDVKNVDLAIAVDGENAIPKTQFTLNSVVATANGDKFDLIQRSMGNAGEWTIYGYNAQIPNVMGVEGTFETILKFTNRSSLDANIYFTLIDQDGTVVELNSEESNQIESLPANQTKQYRATLLGQLAKQKNADFDNSKSFSVEVSIPTTPAKVYGFASFKNIALGQFKDLPIYNTSNMTY